MLMVTAQELVNMAGQSPNTETETSLMTPESRTEKVYGVSWADHGQITGRLCFCDVYLFVFKQNNTEKNECIVLKV